MHNLKEESLPEGDYLELCSSKSFEFKSMNICTVDSEENFEIISEAQFKHNSQLPYLKYRIGILALNKNGLLHYVTKETGG